MTQFCTEERKRLPRSVPLVSAPSDLAQYSSAMLAELVAQQQLPIDLIIEVVSQKLTQKYRQQLSEQFQQPLLLIDDKGQLNLLIEGISVAPDWAKLQRRIVSAGRKSELLLQAAKLTADHRALDATAGFGHDSLILASTGAQVTMVEREPLLTLLLLAEQQKMAREPNWHKLMARLTIVNGASEDYLNAVKGMDDNNCFGIASGVGFDVIYLDPMFPVDSYSDNKTGKGAKVGKHMQALHGLVSPPDTAAEKRLFQLAHDALGVPIKPGNALNDTADGIDISNHKSAQKRLIIKRPVTAPYLAGQLADESWQNDVVRFDGYLL